MMMKDKNSKGDNEGLLPIARMFEALIYENSQILQRDAVIDQEKRVTYDFLNKKANQLARYFISQGVQSQDRVVVYMNRSVELVVIILALWKINAIYVPLDTENPLDRIEFIIKDTQAKTLVSSAEVNNGFLCERKIKFDNVFDSLGSNFSSNNIGLEYSMDDLAYIMYTSGSTGCPKGVQVPHRGIANRLRWTIREHGVGNRGALLSIISIGFSVSLCEMFSPLLSGQKLVVGAERSSKDPIYLKEEIEKNHITFMHFVPTLLNVFLDNVDRASCSLLRKVSCGGEQMSLALCDKFFRKFPNKILYNEYGATELSVAVTSFECDLNTSSQYEKIPAGKEIDKTKIYLLDERNKIVSQGNVGELCVSGYSLAKGYLNLPNITQDRFIELKVDGEQKRLYKTGDLAKRLPDGNYIILGRKDNQIKLRGFRIELDEIESTLSKFSGISQAVVDVREINKEKHLVAYYKEENDGVKTADLRGFLSNILPSYMVPAVYINMSEFPLTARGKINRVALPNPSVRKISSFSHEVQSDEVVVAQIWKKILCIDEIDLDKSIFELGAHSLLILQGINEINSKFNISINYQTIQTYPTIKKMVEYVKKNNSKKKGVDQEENTNTVNYNKSNTSVENEDLIAVVGVGCRFPGAKNIDEYWINNLSGKCTLRQYSKKELDDLGVSDKKINHPDYVGVSGFIDDLDRFDADFFDYSNDEACSTDPHHRLFIQTAWDALENAGLTSGTTKLNIGVFASMGDSQFSSNYLEASDLTDKVTYWEKMVLSSPQYLANKVSYKFNLTGPSININTACSSSLVVLCTACDAILAGHCDVAVVGGVSLLMPNEVGHLYMANNIFSKQGENRPFDKSADGIVISSGVGVVILRKLNDAVCNNDNIYAAIKGYAVNNDGVNKASFVAPSLEGQKKCLMEAQRRANIDPKTITYVETHGSGTPMGDEIELEALNSIFHRDDKNAYCALGSVKANIGHCISASGIAGFIKAVLCIKNKKLVPQIFCDNPIKALAETSSPFYINKVTKDWVSNDNIPRRAAISSFGMGGTNAHVIVEEFSFDKKNDKENEKTKTNNNFNVLLSAKNHEGLYNFLKSLKIYNDQFGMDDKKLRDLAYTLQIRMQHYPHRLSFSSHDSLSFSKKLNKTIDCFSENIECSSGIDSTVVFLFPGQGCQYVDMARELYYENERFKCFMDQCCDGVALLLGIDLLDVLFSNDKSQLNQKMNETLFSQLTIFSVEYSLAKLMIEAGISPDVMVGHSLGEYVAACVAEIFSLKDMLEILVYRGRIMNQAPRGKMLAIVADKDTLQEYLSENLTIATLNSPVSNVVSGSEKDIFELKKELGEKGINCRLLETSHAFHSKSMFKAAKKLKENLSFIRIRPAKYKMISNLTGKYFEKPTSQYWQDQMLKPVKFQESINFLLDKYDNPIFIEMGPGSTLINFVRQITSREINCVKLLPTRKEYENKIESDLSVFNSAMSSLWCNGINIEWNRINKIQDASVFSGYISRLATKSYWPIAVKFFEKKAVDDNMYKESYCERKQDLNIRDLEGISKIWASVLPKKQFDACDDFFACGGDSLSAVSLIRKIEKQLGIELTINELYANSIFKKFCGLIFGKNSKNSTSLSGLISCQKESKSSDVALLLLPPISGIPLCYGSFSGKLNLDLSIYAFTLPSFLGVNAETIYDMAKLFVDQFLENYSQHKRIVVFGWSFGGLIANEMVTYLNSLKLDKEITLILCESFIFEDERLIFDEAMMVEKILSDFKTLNYKFDEKEMRKNIIENLEMAKKYKPSAHGVNGAILLTRDKDEIFDLDKNIEAKKWLNYLCNNKLVVELFGDHFSVFSSKYISKNAKKIEEALINLLDKGALL